MGGRDGQDAMIARDRCLAAIPEVTKVEDARALWRAALRYNHRVKVERPATQESVSRALPHAWEERVACDGE